MMWSLRACSPAFTATGRRFSGGGDRAGEAGVVGARRVIGQVEIQNSRAGFHKRNVEIAPAPVRPVAVRLDKRLHDGALSLVLDFSNLTYISDEQRLDFMQKQLEDRKKLFQEGLMTVLQVQQVADEQERILQQIRDHQTPG